MKVSKNINIKDSGQPSLIQEVSNPVVIKSLSGNDISRAGIDGSARENLYALWGVRETGTNGVVKKSGMGHGLAAGGNKFGAFGTTGEGSRGGKIIGYTNSGLPVYVDANHPAHRNFTMKEHIQGERIRQGVDKRVVRDKNYRKSYGSENLKNTHGEQFHSDADKQVMRYLTEIGQIEPRSDGSEDLPGNLPLTAENAKKYNKSEIESVLNDLLKADDEEPDEDAIEAKNEEAEENRDEQQEEIDKEEGKGGHERDESEKSLFDLASDIQKSDIDEVIDLLKATVPEIVGETQSGKQILPFYGHSDHNDFTLQDHYDAANAHISAQKMSQVPEVRYAHENSFNGHMEAARGIETDVEQWSRGVQRSGISDTIDLMKAGTGEGSRGGVVTGHTSGGIPIYQHSGSIDTSPHTNQYVSVGGNETSYGGETHHLHFKKEDDGSQETFSKQPSNDYVGFAVKETGSSKWKAHDYGNSTRTRFDSKDEALQHLANNHKERKARIAARDEYQENIAASLSDTLDDLIKGGDRQGLGKAERMTEHGPLFGFGTVGTGMGEGSRGGKIIGHTKTGKPIYMVADHDEHAGFSPAEHLEASDLNNHKLKYALPEDKWVHRNNVHNHKKMAYGQSFYEHTAHTRRTIGDYLKLSNDEFDIIKSDLLGFEKLFFRSDDKVGETMHEFKHGELRSGSKKGPKVTDRKQAIAIALNQARKSENNTLDDLVKAIKKPKGDLVYQKGGSADYEKIEAMSDEETAKRIKNGVHENQTARKSYIKAIGPGGVQFDFGPLTGNKIADDFTKILNENSDHTQSEIARGQRIEYDQAALNYINKGEKKYAESVNTRPETNSENQTFEDKVDKSGPPVVNPEIPDVELNLGGEIIKPTSETDAYVLLQHQHLGKSDMDEGIVMDASNTGTGVVLDAETGKAFDVISGEEIK